MNAGDEAWNATQRTHWSPHAGPPASLRSQGPAPSWLQASAASAAAWQGVGTGLAVAALWSRATQQALEESSAMLAPSAFTDIRNATRIVNRRRKRAFIERFVVRHRLG
jgi:hypothetical protein